MMTLLHTIPGAPPELTTTDLISWETGDIALATAPDTMQGQRDLVFSLHREVSHAAFIDCLIEYSQIIY